MRVSPDSRFLPSISAAILLLVITIAAEPPALASVKFIGEFSDVRTTEEHAYGYIVQLWREGDKLFGFFLDYCGPQADPPTDMLEDIKYDATSGRLAFKVHMSVGVMFTGNGKQMPSHDMFTFEGALHKSRLSGKLTHVDERQNKTLSVEQIRLLKTDNESWSNVTSFNGWLMNAKHVIRNAW